MRAELAQEGLEVARLLAVELDVVSVRVEVGGQGALEVVDAVRVGAGEDNHVQLVEYLGRPFWVVVELAEQRQQGFVAGRLVAVLRALYPHADFFGRAAATAGVAVAVGGRQVDVRIRPKLFRGEVSRVVRHVVVPARHFFHVGFYRVTVSHSFS